MVVTDSWKFVHAEGGFRPMLFDLETDPDELHDLGDSAEHAEIIETMYDHLFAWARRHVAAHDHLRRQIMAMRKGAAPSARASCSAFSTKTISIRNC